jgi:hypothetical protein
MSQTKFHSLVFAYLKLSREVHELYDNERWGDHVRRRKKGFRVCMYIRTPTLNQFGSGAQNTHVTQEHNFALINSHSTHSNPRPDAPSMYDTAVTKSSPISSHVSDRYTTHTTEQQPPVAHHVRRTSYRVAPNKKQESTSLSPSQPQLELYALHTFMTCLYVLWNRLLLLYKDLRFSRR